MSYAATDLIQKAIPAEITLPASQQITLPGLAPLSQDENQRLFEAYKAKGPDYIPRTRHRHPDGTPTFINPLIFEASPYLLQHAHNPVHWYAWGNEAFEAARTAGKLILLSIGYSTCYWCHVMETESFEDEEVATTLNSRFIAIKVDREERPDLDKIYMDSVVAIGGRGGWPLTVFLTPELHPVWGATYFPKDQFLHILGQISTTWVTDFDVRFETNWWNTKDHPNRSASVTWSVASTNRKNCPLVTAATSIENGLNSIRRTGSSPSPGT